MTERNVDDLIREWTDIGEEHLPDRYLQAALAEIETTPQRGAWPAPLEGLIMRFQATAPYLAVAAVVVAAVVLYAAFAGPPVGVQDASPTPSPASPESSAPVSPSPTARPVVSGGTFTVNTPTGSVPMRAWEYTGQLATTPRPDGLVGYGFWSLAGATQYSVDIFLNPDTDYTGSQDTSREDLIVRVVTQVNDGAIGIFESTSGECRITFDESTATEAAGSLDCTDVPGEYSATSDPTLTDRVVQLSGTFAFTLSTDYRPGQIP